MRRMKMLATGTLIAVGATTTLTLATREALAQLPPQPPPAQPQPQPYYPPPPVQPYPQQPPPAQPSPQPPQGQPLPQPPPPQYAPQPYPQQPPQPYPPQPYPQQPYPPQPYPPQPYPPQGGLPPTYLPPVADDKRGNGEMAFLYGASVGYGIGAGTWIDALWGVTDPGLAFIAPLAFGAAGPIGVYFLDDSGAFHKGVPASIATGIALGAVEGVGISSLQWQQTNDDRTWTFRTDATVTFLTMTAGGAGGYIFGETLRPDPRSMGLIASGAGWGAIAGTLFGAGVTPDKPGADWKDSASIAGFIGYNAGLVGAGALSTVWTPSWNTQKYMWTGYVAGTAAASVVYVFYLFSSAPVWHGLIANSLGGLAGVAIAGALTADLKDDDAATGVPAHAGKSWKPPFFLTPSTLPNGGAMLNASGMF